MRLISKARTHRQPGAPPTPPRAPRTAERIKTYVYLTWLLLELELKLELVLELEPESRLALIVSFANCDSHMWRPLVSESVCACVWRNIFENFLLYFNLLCARV